MSTFIRAFPLEDISIRSGGDGRTVEAYAAVFDRAVPIRDHQGEYMEQIARGAFRRTIARKGGNFQVFYNHARGIHGQPSDLFSIPIGVPIEVKEDARGLVTVTQYNKTPLAEQVLESIRNGDIKGQSFSGSFVRSDPELKPGYQYRADADGDLPVVTRHEISLVEYGPTPFPAYNEAAILGVRAMLADLLTADQLAQILAVSTRESARDDGNHPPSHDGSVAEDSPDDGHSVRQQWTPEQVARRERLLRKE